MLQGKLKLKNKDNRNKIHNAIQCICDMLSTSDVISHLYQDRVISRHDKEEIDALEQNRGRTVAALSLSFILPDKSREWFSKFIKSLLECKQTDLAKKIDREFATCKAFFLSFASTYFVCVCVFVCFVIMCRQSI